jgi:hypothetical protein
MRQSTTTLQLLLELVVLLKWMLEQSWFRKYRQQHQLVGTERTEEW